ncbi:iron ABC transporter permease [Rhizobium rhizosphaerae]|uniref:Iron ABC transporter permease n=1 Tax=Xaviernesmea rhizosphaerae TaxID=1672749 RepID=A0A1Q9ADV6_9HYPH|nr:iron ABC transporter permease [Xaviernesmea rhizosphaerae]OLP53110.1 iron ABC transporter permease [Xaviernesmea rhizosphaerae]
MSSTRSIAAARPPLLLALPALAAGGAMLVPLVYLVVRAAETQATELAFLVFRPATAQLLANTLSLVVCVLALSTAIALPLAVLVTRCRLPFPWLWPVLFTLPLAVPGYVMAYALIGLSGYYGPLNQVFGMRLPRLEGLSGATLALSLYVYPYLFLNLRTVLTTLDPALEESARSLGHSAVSTFLRVVLPQLKAAFLSGWLVIALYTLGDYGAIALMRYDVFSSAIYSQYAGAFEVYYAAWLALMLIALAGLFLAAEARAARRLHLARTGTGTARVLPRAPLGRMALPAALFIALVVSASLGLPVSVILFWLSRAPEAIDWPAVAATALQTVTIAGPVALLAMAAALPVALVTTRFPGRAAFLAERMVYLGYAVPALPFALAMVFFSLAVIPFFYQSMTLLIATLTLHFLALALGPVRSRLLQLGPRTEEAARSLGHGAFAAFRRVTLPQLMRALVAGGLLVFMVVAKELPITLLLSPTGTQTLAMTVFARSSEGALVDAAPYAGLMILFSSLFVGLVLTRSGRAAGKTS